MAAIPPPSLVKSRVLAIEAAVLHHVKEKQQSDRKQKKGNDKTKKEKHEADPHSEELPPVASLSRRGVLRRQQSQEMAALDGPAQVLVRHVSAVLEKEGFDLPEPQVALCQPLSFVCMFPSNCSLGILLQKTEFIQCFLRYTLHTSFPRHQIFI